LTVANTPAGETILFIASLAFRECFCGSYGVVSSNNVRVKLAAFTGILLALLFFGDKSWDNLLLTLAGALAAAGGVAWNAARRPFPWSAWGTSIGVALLLGGIQFFTLMQERRSVGLYDLLAPAGILVVILLAFEARRASSEQVTPAAATRLVQLSIGFLLASFLWCGVATFLSPFAVIATKLYVRELTVYCAVFLFLLVAWGRYWPALNAAARAGGWVTAAALAAMLLVIIVYGAGILPPKLCSPHGWIRINPGNPADGWRLQFPFEHHNRAGLFGMCATFVVPALLLASTRLRPSVALSCGLAGVIVCVASGTRGAVVGLLVGAVAAGVTGAGRIGRHLIAGAVAAALVVAGFLAFAPAHRAHWLEDFANAGGQKAPTSVSSRIIIQSVSLELAAQRPLTGWGYGYETFEQLAAHSFPAIAAQVEGMSHPHNQWIEQMLASGIFGGLFFLGFTIVRILALGAPLGNRQPQPKDGRFVLILALWIGLEFALQFYGLTNTALRRNIGLWTYCLWAGSAVLALEATRRAQADAVIPSRHPE
jgi:O-antigen ligase